MNTYSEQTALSEIPQDAMTFHMEGGECQFAEGEDKENLRLTLYDGSIVKHWYWGNLAFDLASMKLAKKKIPILADHDTSLRLGYSTGASFEKKFILEGKYLKNSADAAKIRGDSQEGFPFEASLRFDPAKSRMTFLKEGEQTEVNGRVLKGPGTLIENAVIMEGTLCTFGALNNCITESFERTSDMEPKLTAETFAQQSPEAYRKITEGARAEGIQEERERFAKFAETFADDPAFLVEQFQKGATLEEATAAQLAKLKKEMAEMKANPPKAETVQTQTPAPTPAAAESPSPARQEFAADAGGPEKPAEKTGMEAFRADKAHAEFLKMSDGNEAEAFKKWQAAEKAIGQGLVRGAE